MNNKLDLLFQPYKLNDVLTLKNKILMAPMTRNMSHGDGTPVDAMRQYYAKRTDAGLIITEGTMIRPDARGFSNVPGIFTESHIQGWRDITDAVHSNDGKIFLQLWHVGRVSHPIFLEGKLPLSASVTEMTGPLSRRPDLQFGKSSAATSDDIQSLILSYATATKNAMQAGFDGVEIHGANGYLIDQFLHYDTNHRDDDYGKTPENMARFAVEVVKTCGEAIGYERVGLRLSPAGYLNQIVGEPRDALVFQYLLQQLNQYPIAYVHTGAFDDSIKYPELNDLTMTQFVRCYYQETVVACGSYSAAKAVDEILKNQFDLIAMGRAFIANPDLVARLKQSEILQPYTVELLNELN